jgi:hypothetical protein
MNPRHLPLGRDAAVGLLRAALQRDAHPRLQMALIVAITGALGLLCSVLLARLGVHPMALRYPLALLGAYGGFLGLLWCWLRTRPRDYVDVPNLSSSSGPGCAPPHESASDAASGLLQLDEGLLPLAAVLLGAGLLLASVYMVSLAPTLFAELLLDSALSYSLYRRLRHLERSHWLGTAVRRTALPFALTAVFLAVMGAALAACAPGAHSLGQVIAQLRHPGR